MIPGRGGPPLLEPPIQLSKLLVVEGRDAVVFFEALLEHLQLSEIVEIRDMRSVGELTNRLHALKNMSGFAENVISLGIIRDAEAKGIKPAFDSVCNSLRQNGFSVPTRPAEVADGTPRISVFILPNCQGAGMLEDLCLQAVAGDPAILCVEQYFECLRGQGLALPNNLSKARVHAFLASRAKPDLLVGQAADTGYWNLDSPVYEPLKQFLQAL